MYKLGVFQYIPVFIGPTARTELYHGATTAVEEFTRYERGEHPEAITCNICTRKFDYNRQKRTTKNTCRDCLTNRHRFTLKARMVEYKGGGCQVCGYSACLSALDFHHVDPTVKEFNFGGKHCVGVDKLRAELAKCVCLCSNCHRETHTALDAMVWGHDRAPILATIDEVHANWRPREVDWTQVRQTWRERHPKYHNPANPKQRLNPDDEFTADEIEAALAV